MSKCWFSARKRAMNGYLPRRTDFYAADGTPGSLDQTDWRVRLRRYPRLSLSCLVLVAGSNVHTRQPVLT
jgi:hypothetical protein